VTIDHKHPLPQRAGSGQDPSQLPTALPIRDVRRTRQPLLAFLLRGGTIRTFSRVVILLGLDFIGVCAALFTAVAIKLAFRRGFTLHDAWVNTDHFLAFAYLLTALAFARLDLYSDRPRRPGFSKVATGLFQATLLGALFSLADGDHFSSYFIFYGSFAFALLYVSGLREVYTQLTGRLLEQVGYRRRAVLIGSGRHIGAVADALEGDPRTAVEVLGYISLGSQPQYGLRSWARSSSSTTSSAPSAPTR